MKYEQFVAFMEKAEETAGAYENRHRRTAAFSCPFCGEAAVVNKGFHGSLSAYCNQCGLSFCEKANGTYEPKSRTQGSECRPEPSVPQFFQTDLHMDGDRALAEEWIGVRRTPLGRLIDEGDERTRDALIDSLSGAQTRTLLKACITLLRTVCARFKAIHHSKNIDRSVPRGLIEAFAGAGERAATDAGAPPLEPVEFICPACGRSAVVIRLAAEHSFAFCRCCSISVST